MTTDANSPAGIARDILIHDFESLTVAGSGHLCGSLSLGDDQAKEGSVVKSAKTTMGKGGCGSCRPSHRTHDLAGSGGWHFTGEAMNLNIGG